MTRTVRSCASRWRAWRANKLRSGLTILGMTIGVAAVIILVAVGNGSKLAVQERINALGSNVLLVQPQGGRFGPGRRRRRGVTLHHQGRRRARGHVQRARRRARLAGGQRDRHDAHRRLDELPAEHRSPAPSPRTRRRATTTSRAARCSPPTTSSSTSASSCSARRSSQNLFAGADPVGSERAHQRHAVPGRRRDRAQGLQRRPGPGRRRARAADRRPGRAHAATASGLSSITVEAVDGGALDAAQAEVTSILTERKHVDRPDQPGLPGHQPGRGARGAATPRTDVFTTLLGAVAAISLLVGGIGVMNIMLVSVTERTREIGIRKAIGARRARHPRPVPDRGGARLGARRRHRASSSGSSAASSGSPASSPRSPCYSVFLAFGASVLAGLFFGTYPAGRAARMRPIDALRFE